MKFRLTNKPDRTLVPKACEKKWKRIEIHSGMTSWDYWQYSRQPYAETTYGRS